jgi:hypothetical protein
VRVASSRGWGGVNYGSAEKQVAALRSDDRRRDQKSLGYGQHVLLELEERDLSTTLRFGRDDRKSGGVAWRHGMAWVGDAVGGVCGGDGGAGEGGGFGGRQQSGDGDPDDGDPGVYVGDRDCARKAWWDGGDLAAELGIPGAVGAVHGTVVDLLFSGAADGAGVECGADR